MVVRWAEYHALGATASSAPPPQARHARVMRARIEPDHCEQRGNCPFHAWLKEPVSRLRLRKPQRPDVKKPLMHDVLIPAGPQAAHIAQYWWVMLGVCAFVFAAVMVALAVAVWRAPKAEVGAVPDAAPPEQRDRRAGRSVGMAVALSIVLLMGLLAGSIETDRALAGLSLVDAVPIHVTAHQWWWEVTYDDADPQRVFSTANELHVPVGRPVIVTLQADDVIHSFWVPSLHGKKDLIPGRTSTIQFRADKPGRYRGQCAEYCGLQHAYMAFEVVATTPQAYEAWAEAQRRSAADPADSQAQRGRDLFLSGSCMLCHAVRGTSAGGRKAPDLTHIASRQWLAAGRIPNTPSDLEHWIRDPQSVKPGVNMPAHPLADDDMKALVAYLETLR